jgi:cellobiose-specific phosphotransferase system component IIB
MTGRVLLITPQFYGIENKIQAVLEESGYEVTWIENKTPVLDYHGTESKLKPLRRIYSALFSPQVRYLRKEFKKTGNKKFDILFVINADVVCHYLLKKLKDSNPRLISIIYFWDSFKKFNWTREFKLFDKVVTFDPEDALKHEIDYLPNFYIRHDLKINHDQKYDLFFVGKFSSERVALLDKIDCISETAGINSFIRLWPAFRMYPHNSYVYRILRRLGVKGKWTNNYILNFEAIEGILKRKYLVNDCIEYDKVQSIMHCSNVVLDLPFKNQTGYTHRLIEAMANGKKVLTTNSNVRKETFFNPDQIHILDDLSPEFDSNWIEEVSEFSIDSSFLNLELSNWLKSILNVGIA